MTKRGGILVCILPDLTIDILRGFLTNATYFAKQLGVDLHLLTSDNAVALQTAMGDLPPGELQSLKVVTHTIPGDWPPGAVVDAVHLYAWDLIVVPSGRMSDDNGHGARVRKYLLEGTSEPLVLLSSKVNLAKTSIGSVLIPMSGEIRVSSALKFGLHLASRLHVPVDLVHVLTEDACNDSPLEASGDQPHHEYRDLLDRVLAEASPFSDARERAQVRTLYDVRGLPAVEILKAAKNIPSCIVVAEWHGSLIHGRAEILKQLLQEAARPVFVVKAELEQSSILKIGPENRVA